MARIFRAFLPSQCISALVRHSSNGMLESNNKNIGNGGLSNEKHSCLLPSDFFLILFFLLRLMPFEMRQFCVSNYALSFTSLSSREQEGDANEEKNIMKWLKWVPFYCTIILTSLAETNHAISVLDANWPLTRHFISLLVHRLYI